MQAAATMDAKAPLGRPAAFVAETAAKRAAASEALRTAVESFSEPALRRLQALHAGAGP
jgi:hypothetical protein